MKREIITTGDGSKTIQIVDWNEQYHSKHGAVNEALHVFIKSGLHFYLENEIANTPVDILEIGFGTGLNTLLTVIESRKLQVSINYTGVEAYPIDLKEAFQLNYVEQIDGAESNIYKKLHKINWGNCHEISEGFNFIKRRQFFSEIKDEDAFDIIYFDAFGARVQPELWTASIFQKMYDALKLKGVLVTYSAKGSVRRAMQSIGFEVERLEGPPGKRHMLRGIKV